MPQGDFSGIETAEVSNGSQAPALNSLGSSVIVMSQGRSREEIQVKPIIKLFPFPGSSIQTAPPGNKFANWFLVHRTF